MIFGLQCLGLWVQRLLIGGSPFQGQHPASEVNDGSCPENQAFLHSTIIPPLGTSSLPKDR